MKSNGQFGRVGVKSYVDYKASNGRPRKGMLGKGKKVKREEDEIEKEVVIKLA